MLCVEYGRMGDEVDESSLGQQSTAFIEWRPLGFAQPAAFKSELQQSLTHLAGRSHWIGFAHHAGHIAQSIDNTRGDKQGTRRHEYYRPPI